MRVLAYRGDIFGECSVSFGYLCEPGEGRGSYELGETEVNLRDTQFLGIGKVLQEVY